MFRATTEYFVRHELDVKTPLAKEAVQAAAKQSRWSLHGLGLDVWESTPDTFRPGHVLCFEPVVVTANQSYFVEDCVVITPAGSDRLNPPLPYQPEDIENAMRVAGSRVKH